jgi:hypothetical protein
MRVWSTGQPPAKGNCPGLSSGVIEGFMTLVDEMRPIATPHTDLCGLAMQAPSVQIRQVCRVIIYIGTVVVVRHVNL